MTLCIPPPNTSGSGYSICTASSACDPPDVTQPLDFLSTTLPQALLRRTPQSPEEHDILDLDSLHPGLPDHQNSPHLDAQGRYRRTSP